jgi:hypothetical protein
MAPPANDSNIGASSGSATPAPSDGLRPLPFSPLCLCCSYTRIVLYTVNHFDYFLQRIRTRSK